MGSWAEHDWHHNRKSYVKIKPSRLMVLDLRITCLGFGVQAKLVDDSVRHAIVLFAMCK